MHCAAGHCDAATWGSGAARYQQQCAIRQALPSLLTATLPLHLPPAVDTYQISIAVNPALVCRSAIRQTSSWPCTCLPQCALTRSLLPLILHLRLPQRKRPSRRMLAAAAAAPAAPASTAGSCWCTIARSALCTLRSMYSASTSRACGFVITLCHAPEPRRRPVAMSWWLHRVRDACVGIHDFSEHYWCVVQKHRYSRIAVGEPSLACSGCYSLHLRATLAYYTTM